MTVGVIGHPPLKLVGVSGTTGSAGGPGSIVGHFLSSTTF